MLPFELAEYHERVKKTKEKMVAAGIDVMVIADPANMNYLSGYDGWSFYVPQCLILMLDREQPIWVGRGQDANGARLTTWLDEENIRAYTDDYVHSAVKHPMDYVADIIKAEGYGDKTIGLEMDAYYFTAKCCKRLEMKLPNAKFKDATLLVNYVRIIKSPREIEYMKKAARLVEKAMQTAIDYINEGVRECDVVANIYHSMISGTEDFGGDYPAIVPLLPSGEKTSTPHLTWSDEKYKRGDTVIIELAGCYKRYHSPLARTLVLEPAPAKVHDLAAVVVEGINAALDFIKPGVTAAEVEAVWRKTIEKSGFKKESRIGYSMGLNYPPDWGEHTVSLRPEDNTVLQPNMTFHMIPGIWLDDCGVEISESFLVTENGCEVFANFPRMLFVK
ncbi:Peptidase M24, structural domain [Moorella glycerini]|uniref:Peptidase n=1 Tax=Neomoorella stamsii TaxID=1266720 RepID=A0A9X7J0S1_9FIRM|nr:MULTISPECIES: M24 family metallopeptidase [Moorella]PRR68856.1 putative peptidase [Moorella stamsii]CEP67477.1 Peptidase M24, structural domain [Moorella glycerini]